MKNKKLLLKNILFIFFIICLSFLIELLVFNFKSISVSHNGVKTINDYATNDVNGKKQIKIKLNNDFIKKLKFKYSAKDDVSVKIDYCYNDYYGKKAIATNETIFDSEIQLQVLNFNKKINYVKLTYDSELQFNLSKVYIDNNLNINIFRLIFIFSCLMIMFILVNAYKNGNLSKCIHKYYFIIGFIIGINFILLQPSTTFYSWDDQIHFQNSYELFGNNFNWNIGEFSMINYDTFERNNINSIEEQNAQDKYLNKGKMSNYYTSTGKFITYNKIAYFPSSIGYHICKLLKLPFTFCFKFGKIMNLLTFLLVMSFAIYYSKIGKKTLTIIGLLPSVLFLACQYSYDPAVISGITLAMVILINWFTDKDSKVNFKTLFIFVFSILYACFTKAVYIPLILLFLLIPSDRFKNGKNAKFTKLMIFIIFMLIMITFILPSNFSTNMGGDSRGGATNASEQLHLILKKPVGYIRVLKDTALDQFFDKIIGQKTLGGFSYIGTVSTNVYYIVLIVLLSSVMFNSEKFKLKKIHKISFIIISLGIILLIWTALYISFTPVSLNTINGVQSRYFIPIIFPILICFNSDSPKKLLPSNKYYLITIFIMCSCLMLSIYKILLLNYCL